MTEESAKLIENFTAWLTAKGYKPRGIEEKERTARQYIEYLEATGGDITIANIRDAEGYREHMLAERGLDANTVNLRIAYLRLFYRYLMGAGRAVKNPFMDIDRMRESERIPKNILTIVQMGKLLSAIETCGAEDVAFKVVIELLYSTGARISEIENLRREDIDLDAGVIVIRDDKSRKDRKLPLTGMARECLALFVDNTPTDADRPFFLSRPRALGARVNRRLHKLTKKLGLPPLTCHGIRHTTATHLLKKGADIREVQEIWGHRHIKDTEVYLRIFPDDLLELIEKRHPREVLEDETHG